VLGRDLDWVIEDSIAFTADDGRLLDEVCLGRDVPTELVVKLLDVERAAHGLKRRHAVHTRIEDLFRQEWRDLGAVLEERLAGRQADEVEGDEELEALAMQPALDFDKDVPA
jgi:DNA sulfur modification protein DndC